MTFNPFFDIKKNEMLKKFCENSQVFKKINKFIVHKEIKVFWRFVKKFFYSNLLITLQLLLCKISDFNTFNVVDLFLIFISWRSIHNSDQNLLLAGNV